MATRNSLGPIQRPVPAPAMPRLRADYSTPPTLPILDLREAMDRARRMMRLWGLLCVHVDTSTGLPLRDVVRILGDGSQPQRGIALDINGHVTHHPNRLAAYKALVERFHDCMRTEWEWCFMPYPQWPTEAER